jgi:hypothetical protein
MTHVIEDRYFIVSIPVRESQRVRYYVHEDIGRGGYRLSRAIDGAARVRDLVGFVRAHQTSLDAHARRLELGTLIWSALGIVEHRLEAHEESFAWSGLINAPVAQPALSF